MDKAYVDFAALYHIHTSGAFFITRAKTSMDYSVVECICSFKPICRQADCCCALRAQQASLLPATLVETLHVNKINFLLMKLSQRSRRNSPCLLVRSSFSTL